MSRTRTQHPPIYSRLASDPRLTGLIANFVEEIPARVVRLKRHLAAKDWPALYRSVHQLKGAAGTYGFEELVPLALKVENEISQAAEPKRIAASVQELVVHCNRVTAAAAEPSVRD